MDHPPIVKRKLCGWASLVTKGIDNLYAVIGAVNEKSSRTNLFLHQSNIWKDEVVILIKRMVFDPFSCTKDRDNYRVNQATDNRH